MAEDAFNSLKQLLRNTKKVADIGKLIANSAVLCMESYLKENTAFSLFR